MQIFRKEFDNMTIPPLGPMVSLAMVLIMFTIIPSMNSLLWTKPYVKCTEGLVTHRQYCHYCTHGLILPGKSLLCRVQCWVWSFIAFSVPAVGTILSSTMEDSQETVSYQTEFSSPAADEGCCIFSSRVLPSSQMDDQGQWPWPVLFWVLSGPVNHWLTGK